MECDLYFDSHILLCLIITLILIIHIIHIISIKCVYVRECYIYILSLPTSHFSSCCCESTLSLCTPISILLLCYWPPTYCLQLLLISVTVIHWIMAHMTLQASTLLVASFFIKSCTVLLWVD